MSAAWVTVYSALYQAGIKTESDINAVSSSRLTSAEKQDVLASAG